MQTNNEDEEQRVDESQKGVGPWGMLYWGGGAMKIAKTLREAKWERDKG